MQNLPIPPPTDVASKLVEAARYAVLRRLAPAIRHGIVGKLHIIALGSDILNRRAQVEIPDMTALKERAEQLQGLSQKVMRSCANFITWFSPEEDTVVSVADGVEECLALLSTEFGFNGFSLQNNAAGIDAMVSRTALRTLLCASLLTAIDTTFPPSNLLIIATLSPYQVEISILIQPTDDENIGEIKKSYRDLAWDDVEVLANAEGVKLAHQADRISMHYPIRTI